MTVDHRADIYALGLVLNEMFTGQVPLGTGYKAIGSVASDFSYLDDIVSTMLRQSAEERPASIEVIKRELIGHKQEFITRQRLSDLKQTAVSVTDLDDPLIVDPPRLVNIDVEPGVLILLFQRPVTPKWQQSWIQMGRTSSITCLMNKDPEKFSFSGNRASIPARGEDEMQRIVNDFKTWIPMANSISATMVLKEQQELENQRRTQLQQEIEEQERRRRILTSVRI
jgi:serine/threonine protein kinase